MDLDTNLKNVELHLHLDGAVRPQTLFELAQKRQIVIPYSTVEELRQALLPVRPYSLKNFLKGFSILLQLVAGDREAIARITAECVEDCVTRSGLCYVELRFSPHLLAGSNLSPDDVVTTVLDISKQTGDKHGIQVRLILCILRDHPDTADSVLVLAVKYKKKGVVAIDVSGDDSVWPESGMPIEIVNVFHRAKALGIHRTVHAGENSPADAVLEAIERLHAERIGHGYSIMNNLRVFDVVRKNRIHLEVCPSSSWLTGAVVPGVVGSHPVCRFAADGFNFSLNTDAPLMTSKWLFDEFTFCMTTLGLTGADLRRSRVNAAGAAFLDDEQQRETLLRHVLG
ncbi:hypothetical protein PHET_05975 [Paragonimus heterotremus]|uniref:adenosine deaminase n=1 Tax=Paragonimus heterotremus TaxID=100268 RepID=A0A8J4WGC7_9TREM|nr:hypothetical protein PHET_05975 [Paragonimus heterotremus]